jgi:hypothetical protein
MGIIHIQYLLIPVVHSLSDVVGCHPRCRAALLAAGARIDVTGLNISPLSIAVLHGTLKTMKQLIAASQRVTTSSDKYEDLMGYQKMYQ